MRSTVGRSVVAGTRHRAFSIRSQSMAIPRRSGSGSSTRSVIFGGSPAKLQRKLESSKAARASRDHTLGVAVDKQTHRCIAVEKASEAELQNRIGTRSRKR